MNKLTVFVGYDAREDVAFQVCRHSIAHYSRKPIQVIPLIESKLRVMKLYNRPFRQLENGQRIDLIDMKPFSTDFSFTRFLVPTLYNHDYRTDTSPKWVVFVDCDFLFQDDLNKVIAALDPTKAVYVVKHDYAPKDTTKMDGMKQENYRRKNWSSFIVFNVAHPANAVLTPEYINQETGAKLHGFDWLKDEEIGSLDIGWNLLEGHYTRAEAIIAGVKAIHYTRGGPWFEEYKNVQYADAWNNEYEHLLNYEDRIL